MNWFYKEPTFLRTFSGHTKSINSVAFSPDGELLASGSSDSTIKLWKLKTGEEVQTLLELGAISSVAFSPDGELLASGSSDSTIKLWNVKMG